jgi:hypothetical protein
MYCAVNGRTYSFLDTQNVKHQNSPFMVRSEMLNRWKAVRVPIELFLSVINK